MYFLNIAMTSVDKTPLNRAYEHFAAHHFIDFLTWKKAIPKDIPAMIPRLDSMALVTFEKHPCKGK